MARARGTLSAVTMPEHLRWRNVAAFLDLQPMPPDSLNFQSENEVQSWRKIQASRALRSARAAFLSQVSEKPDGVSDYEYLAAHGLTREALGTSVARSLGL